MKYKYIVILFAPLMIGSVSADAHHIRGIPHYSYRDNYPETPVYEIIDKVAHYEVVFTYYSIPGQQALDLAVYIKDTVTLEPYTEPVVFRVFGRHEDPDESHPFTAYRNPTNVYKVGWVYEDDGDYHVRVTFTDSLKTHNILLDLSVGESRRSWFYLGGTFSLVLIFIVLTAVVKRKRGIPAKA
jgi:hypothetical protein